MLGQVITHGFTYDQSSEPIGPIAGQTWRERSGGSIVGEWEWNGSFWLGLSRNVAASLVYTATLTAANTTITTANGLFGTANTLNLLAVNASVFVLEAQLRTHAVGTITSNFSSTNKFSLSFELNAVAFNSANRAVVVDADSKLITQSYSTFVRQARYPINRVYTLQANTDIYPHFRVGEIVGTPAFSSFPSGNPRWLVSCIYREVRS